MAVVAVIKKGSSKEEDVMQLLRCLTFIQAQDRFNIRSAHIKGKDTDWADALSRGNTRHFLSCHPQARRQATPLSPELLDLTIIRKPEWTSQLWTELWNDIFGPD